MLVLQTIKGLSLAFIKLSILVVFASTEGCGYVQRRIQYSEPFENHCAYSISIGDTKTFGKNSLSLFTGKRIYYFSSESRMDRFVENLKKNIEKANHVWNTKLEKK